MLNVGDTYTVKIDDINIYANGVCRVDNIVVFVKNALKGENCLIRITEVYPNYAYAIVEEYIKISPERENPSCPHFQNCGGCSFLHTTIDEENRIKVDYVKRSFEKQGINASFEKIVCPISNRYRNKVVLFYNGESFGYMKSESGEIVPHSLCLLNDDIFDEIAKKTGEILKDTSLRALYMRKSYDSKEIMICPIFYKKLDIDSYVQEVTGKFPQIKTIYCANSSDEKLVLEKLHFNLVYGEGYIKDQICGLEFRISPESFYQVNHTCAEQLYEKAIELANLNENSKCADLFCGTGTIGIIASKKTGAKVYGVEIVTRAVEDAKYNADINGASNANFEAKDAGKFDKKIDTAIIDPPRKGCNKIMLNTLLRLKPKRIVYVSCNVDTMVRDLKALLDEYKLSSPVFTYNLFPHTSHVESVVCLTRK